MVQQMFQCQYPLLKINQLELLLIHQIDNIM